MYFAVVPMMAARSTSRSVLAVECKIHASSFGPRILPVALTEMMGAGGSGLVAASIHKRGRHQRPRCFMPRDSPASVIGTIAPSKIPRIRRMECE
jgi:hypothetical protein